MTQVGTLTIKTLRDPVWCVYVQQIESPGVGVAGRYTLVAKIEAPSIDVAREVFTRSRWAGHVLDVRFVTPWSDMMPTHLTDTEAIETLV